MRKIVCYFLCALVTVMFFFLLKQNIFSAFPIPCPRKIVVIVSEFVLKVQLTPLDDPMQYGIRGYESSTYPKLKFPPTLSFSASRSFIEVRISLVYIYLVSLCVIVITAKNNK